MSREENESMDKMCSSNLNSINRENLGGRYAVFALELLQLVHMFEISHNKTVGRIKATNTQNGHSYNFRKPRLTRTQDVQREAGNRAGECVWSHAGRGPARPREACLVQQTA